MPVKYIVQTPFTLGFGSNTRDPNAKQHRRYKKGDILLFDSEAPNGNVWFYDPKDNARGKIEAGSIENMLKDNRLRAANLVRQ